MSPGGCRAATRACCLAGHSGCLILKVAGLWTAEFGSTRSRRHASVARPVALGLLAAQAPASAGAPARRASNADRIWAAWQCALWHRSRRISTVRPMFRVAQQVAVSPPWWATVVIAGLFTLLGAILTLTVTVTLDRRKAARDARMAREVRAREAYLRILTWVTHIKDELRRTIDGRREFNHALVDEREQASLGALSQLDTGPQFRSF